MAIIHYLKASQMAQILLFTSTGNELFSTLSPISFLQKVEDNFDGY